MSNRGPASNRTRPARPRLALHVSRVLRSHPFAPSVFLCSLPAAVLLLFMLLVVDHFNEVRGLAAEASCPPRPGGRHPLGDAAAWGTTFFLRPLQSKAGLNVTGGEHPPKGPRRSRRSFPTAVQVYGGGLEINGVVFRFVVVMVEFDRVVKSKGQVNNYIASSCASQSSRRKK